MEEVDRLVGPQAYSSEESARKRAFKRDREHLRNELQVEFSYDPCNRTYQLEDPGPFGQIDLSESSLATVATLVMTFKGPAEGGLAAVQSLLNDLLRSLPPETRRRLESIRPGMEIDLLTVIDPSHISERVWKTIQRAIDQRRRLGFHSCSPRHEDGLRYYEVAAHRLRFRNGHWYLDAFPFFARHADGTQRSIEEQRTFRLSYICDDDALQVFPSRVPESLRRPLRHVVHYLLLPPLSRGSISRHFMDMQITMLPDGCAEVTGYSENDWEAGRILLSYGEQCIVKGGPEIHNVIRERVRKMAENYGFVKKSEGVALIDGPEDDIQ